MGIKVFAGIIKLKILRWEVTLNYPSGPQTTSQHPNKTGRIRWHRCMEQRTVWNGSGHRKPQAKEQWPDFLQESPEGAHRPGKGWTLSSRLQGTFLCYLTFQVCNPLLDQPQDPICHLSRLVIEKCRPIIKHLGFFSFPQRIWNFELWCESHFEVWPSELSVARMEAKSQWQEWHWMDLHELPGLKRMLKSSLENRLQGKEGAPLKP